MGIVGRALAVLIASAGTAHAEPQPLRLFTGAPEQSRSSHRQFAMPSDQVRTVRPSAFLAAVSVSQNTTIAVGRFNFLPRRRVSMHDQPVTLERKGTRRAAIGLSFRF